MTVSISNTPQAQPRYVDARRAFVRWMRQNRGRASSLAILRAQQEATLDGILVVDTEGRILSHNRRFLEIKGMTPSEFRRRANSRFGR